MKETKYIEKNGVPYFKVGEEEIPAVAYITYFEERNEYKKFTDLGYRIFSVSVSTASRAINSQAVLCRTFLGFLTKRELRIFQ